MSEQESSLQQHDENHIMAERREKLKAIREAGVAFPNDFKREHLSGDLHAAYNDKSKEELEPLNIQVAVAGRMMLKRVMGKASFATLQDVAGQIQLYINDQGVGADIHAAFKHWDMGDILRRAVGKRIRAAPAVQIAAPAAGQIPRHDRPRTKIPPALR